MSYNKNYVHIVSFSDNHYNFRVSIVDDIKQTLGSLEFDFKNLI